MTDKQLIGVTKRFIKYLDIIDEKGSTVYTKVGLGQSHWSQIKTFKRNLSLSQLLKISKCYEDLNTNWLLTGSGEMIKHKYLKDSNIGVNDTNTPYRKTITDVAELSRIVLDLQDQVLELRKKNRTSRELNVSTT